MTTASQSPTTTQRQQQQPKPTDARHKPIHKPIPKPKPVDVAGWRDTTARRIMIPHVSTQRMLIPIEVYIDFICPWCYIEMRSLEAAMDQFVSQHPEVEFEVSWKPFYIAPMMKSSCKTLDFYNNALPEDKLRGLLERIRVAGVAYGLSFDYSGSIGPTRNAHKLVALATRRGGRKAQAHMVERLMKTGLCDGQDLSDIEVLAKVASDSLGLDRDDVFLELADDDATRRIDREVEAARETRGIEAVPCVTVLGRFKVGGFQDSHVFTDLFAKIYEEKIA